MTAMFQTNGKSVLVNIVEEFKTVSRGMYTRAITEKGNRIAAPSRLFTKIENNKAAVNPEEISMEAKLAALRNHWASK